MYLAIPLLQHPLIHGDNAKLINNHYICYTIISVEDFINNNHEDFLTLIKDNVNKDNIKNYSHPIRNYMKIASNPKVEIVDIHRLKSGEDICVIKTYLIKQIQRRWRKIYKNKIKKNR